MTNREFFIECWEQEYPTFLQVFRAVPAARVEYRPHPRSRSAAELVWVQVLEKRCWVELLDTGKIQWRVPPAPMDLGEMILAYERAHAELAPRLKALDEKSWNEKPTQFLMGSVSFETVMGHMFWSGLFDAIHHRGQLTTYLRPMGGRVPAIYAPSGDDATFGNLRGLERIG